MHSYEYNLSLRFRHKERDVESVFEALKKSTGLIPGRIWKVGDKRLTNKGKELEGTYDKSYCFLDLFSVPQKSEIESPVEAINRALNSLTSINDILVDHKNSGGEIELLLSLFIDANSGLILDPATLRNLVEQDIELSFDIYPPPSPVKDKG